MAAAVTTDTIDSQHLFYKETQYFFQLKLLYNEIDNVKIVTNKAHRVSHVKFQVQKGTIFMKKVTIFIKNNDNQTLKD